MKKRSRYNQTIFNTCVWGYGSIDNIAQFVFDNGLKFDDSIVQGTEVVFAAGIGNDEVKEYIERNALIPVNRQRTDVPDFAWLWSDSQDDITEVSDGVFGIYK